MAATKLSYKDRCIRVRNELRLEIIDGKWFVQNKELKSIDEYLLWHDICKDSRDVTSFKQTYVMMYQRQDADKEWPEPEIVAEARRTIDQKEPLPLPFTDKMLKIYRALIDGTDHMFILTGVGGSGKSTYINVLERIYDGDCSHASVHELGSEYGAAVVFGKRLNTCTELDSKQFENKKVKQLISKEIISFNEKYGPKWEGRCRASFLFSCNNVPKVDLTDTGILRRIIYYHMNKKIENPDPAIATKKWSYDDLVNIVRWVLSVDMTDWEKDFEQETRWFLVKDESVFRNWDDNYLNYVNKCDATGEYARALKNWEDIRQTILEWGGPDGIKKA